MAVLHPPFRRLPALGRTPSKRRIAIASVDIAGPYHCGGVGAAYHGLALALAGAGHDVTLVYLHHKFHQGDIQEWFGYFEARGIRFVHLPQPPDSPIWYANRKEASLRCYEWLSRQPPFDAIHFHEWLGLPYYSLLAKKQGLAFQDTTLLVGAHGPMRWSRIGDESLTARAEDLVIDFLERRSVELADVVVSPSRYLLEWMRDDGWMLPPNSFVEHNILEGLNLSRDRQDDSIQELVFFGRLDRRKGLPFFCDVLDRLVKTCQFSIAFLGSESAIDGKRSVEYLRARAAAWNREPAYLTSLGRKEALEYLSGAGRLAVMPSQLDNSPCTVQECIQEGIPFLASDRGGIQELVDPDDRDRVTAPLRLGSFAARLEAAIHFGHGAARPAQSLRMSRDNWIQWHAAVPLSEDDPGDGSVNRGAEAPLVSICIAHYQRPALLGQMLESLRGQTYPRLEVIVVDDGSAGDETETYLSGLKEEFARRGWQLLCQENAGPGIARDRAARAARGSYFLFADDDDAFMPHAVETFVKVAIHTCADALTCVLMEFEGQSIPARLEDAIRPLIPLGAALAPGLICPEFGGTAYMVKRDCYFAIGGFPRERDIDEDWEFLLSVVARGYNLQAIPEPLVWYRAQPASRSRADNRFVRNRSRIRIYEKLLPLELRDLAALAFTRLSSAPDAGAQKRLERVIQSLERVRRERTNPA